MSLLGIKRSVKKAWLEDWPLSKVQEEIDILFEIAEAAQRVSDNEARLEGEVAIQSSLEARRKAMGELRSALAKAYLVGSPLHKAGNG